MNINTIEIEDNCFIKKLLLLVFVKTEIKPILFYKRYWKKMFNNYEMKKIYFELFTLYVLMISSKTNSFFYSRVNSLFNAKQKLINFFRQLFYYTFRLVINGDHKTSKTTTIYNNNNIINANFFGNIKRTRISYLNTLIINY